MAPTIPLDYAGHRESNCLSKTGLRGMMGKTRKVSKGHSARFVPDYRHVVETMAESDGFGSSGRMDTGLTASLDSSALSRKCPSFNVDGYERPAVPIQTLYLSKLSSLERRDLRARLKSELDLVKQARKKIASYGSDAVVYSPTNDVHSSKGGPKRPAMLDTMPMSAHDAPRPSGKKKFPPGRNGPRTKGNDVPPRRNELAKQGLSQSTSLTMLMKQCDTLLARLMAHPHAWIFNTPVDVVKHNIPDYYNVIKHPMDLGTIKSKLDSNQYTSPVEFAADVRLTFKNAMTYNPAGNEVHLMAEILSKFFEMRWKPIEKKIPPTAEESTPSKSSVVIEPETVYVPPTKKQKTTMENKVNHVRKRVMSDVDKQKLSGELESSLAELPENIINFLKESTLSGSQVSEDEIEIDIDVLSDDTLFKLRKLLDDYLVEKHKNQAITGSSQTQMQKDSGVNDFSSQPCKDDEAADEYVDIGGNESPPTSSFPAMRIDNKASRRNSNCSNSRSSSSESGSSSTDTESGSSASEDGIKNSVLANTVKENVNTRVEWKQSDLGEPPRGDSLNGDLEQNSSFTESNCRQEGEGVPPERQVSPEKQYRAALLRSRFADIIIKAQENTTEKGAEKLKLEKEELERRRREEKARLQREAKAAEEARRKAEAEAAAEAKRKRELEREAARQALQRMEKTVDINENSHFMEDLEMFRYAPDEPLQSFMEEGSPENSQNGLGSFKLQGNSNPLEQLGLYMKNDDENDEEEEEEEAEPQNNPESSNDPEEGEID